MSIRTRLIIAAVVLLGQSLPATAGEIHDAIENGELARVEQLLESDPSLLNAPNGNNEWQELPIHTAARHGQIQIARLLLARGADIEAGDTDESTPLHVAAVSRQPDMAAFLLLHGADANRRDKNGAYGLSFAASGGDSATVQHLLDAGADLNFQSERGYTLLHYAAVRNVPHLLDRLIERGDDVNRADNDGATPLHWAARTPHTEMIERLLELGANPSLPDSGGATPLHSAAGRGRLEAVEILLAHGVDPDPVSRYQRTPLLWATREGHLEVVQLLLNHQVNVNQQDEWGRGVLTQAVNTGNAELVRSLLVAGADPSVSEDHYGYTALHQAVLKGYEDVVEALIAGNADVNSPDNAGSTPLALARRYGHGAVAELLVAKGGKAKQLTGGSDCSLAAQDDLDSDEAIVWYLGHSAWAIKTSNHLLVFDYHASGRAPDNPSLCNGNIAPSELTGENVTVFASHEHGDHYDPAIFEWRDEIPGVTYVLGCQPDDVSGYQYIAPRAKQKVDGMTVSTIESNDSGVGFLVDVDGLRIFHAGDHANRQRDFSGPYTAEIDYLATAGVRPDIAFMPISGCGFGDQVAVKMGVHYAIDSLKPQVFIPMHGGSGGHRYREFIEEAAPKHPDVQMVAFEHEGEHFRFGNGKMSLTAGGSGVD
jgi:ankyrin repeat protein